MVTNVFSNNLRHIIVLVRRVYERFCGPINLLRNTKNTFKWTFNFQCVDSVVAVRHFSNWWFMCPARVRTTHRRYGRASTIATYWLVKVFKNCALESIEQLQPIPLVKWWIAPYILFIIYFKILYRYTYFPYVSTQTIHLCLCI